MLAGALFAATTAARSGGPAYLTAALVTVTGGVIVAVIAAVTAHRRLTRELTGAVQRQAGALVAEAERQAVELEHARKLADLDAVRALVDEASLHLIRGDALRRALTGQTPPGLAEVPADSDRKLRFGHLVGQLRIRLGVTHPITVAFAEAQSALRELCRVSASSPSDASELQRYGDAYCFAADRFHEAAFESVGVSLPPAPAASALAATII